MLLNECAFAIGWKDWTRNWVDAGTRREAFYSFVPPGNYRFQVIACNGDGVWNEAGANLAADGASAFLADMVVYRDAALGLGIVGAGGARIVEKRRLQPAPQTPGTGAGIWSGNARASPRICTI